VLFYLFKASRIDWATVRVAEQTSVLFIRTAAFTFNLLWNNLGEERFRDRIWTTAFQGDLVYPSTNW